MNDHPPIPPNCERFEIRDGNLFFLVNSWTESDCAELKFRDEWVEFDRLTWPIKFGAICIARCAWLDEAKRLNNLRKEQRHKPVSERPNYTSPWVDANINADAWRVFGE